MKIKSKKIPLKEVATFLNGYAFKPSDWSKEGLPIIRIQNLTGTNKEFNYYNGDYNEKYIIEDGDILISWSASLGIFLWKNITGILNQHIFKVIFDKDIETDKLYFLHCMKYLIKKIEKNIHGSTMKHITRPEFEKINFPIYDIDIQRKIAKKLVFISEIIDNNKRILVKLMDLSKSLFTMMFGDPLLNDKKEWNFFKIKNIGKIISGSTPSTNISEYWNGEYLWITPAELNDDSFIINSTNRKLTYLGVKTSSLIELPIGTVLLSSRAPIGKVAIVGENMFCNQGFKNIIPNEKINSIYLYYVFKEKKEYLNFLGRGATFKELSKEIVENISIKVPPIELQNKFAERIEKIEKLKFEIEKSIETAQNLYDSLISKYFDN